MTSEPKLHRYETRDALAEGLATGVAAVLADGIATRGQASLAVSGGTTPRLFFETLSRTELDWSCVTVLLVDERFVPADSERSNTRLVRRHLLQGPAAEAQLLTYPDAGETAEEAAAALDPRLHMLVRPFDAVILGMGTDGHTASFFPGANRLAEAIDPAGSRAILALEAPGAGEPRLTLTLPFLADARLLAIHIEGDEKLSVLEQAHARGPEEDMPVRAMLRAERADPIQIFWAP